MLLLKLNMIHIDATAKALILVLALLVVSHTNTACTDQELQTLLSFLGSLSAPPQSWNFTVESDCCKWEGITCNPSSSITEISLPGNRLTGKISPVLSNLTNLSYLNLSNNFLTGSLPVELLYLSTSLKTLDVSFNILSGKVPAFQNPVIQVLDISSNFLTGLLPIINATSLHSLNATKNSLTGSVPDYLCTNSPFLISLAISYNEFSGEISPELGNCTALQDFQADSNNLVGSLPDELFKLTSLENLRLSTNFLTGSIPIAIGQLKRLRSLHLSDNNLIGPLPSAIENCSDVRQLILRVNSLTGHLRFINFTKLPNLEMLDLYNNSFTGEIPDSIYTCKNLIALRLSRNKLSGQISPAIENLRALSFLSLSTNNFVNITGALKNLSKCKNLMALLITKNFIGEAVPIEPTWENGFENIQILSLQGNNFTGTIPSWISKMTKLEVLDICCNRFTGNIPDWLGNLSSLFYLDLSHNYLSGNIPKSITHLSSLFSVDNLKRVNPAYLGLPLYFNQFKWTLQQYFKQYNQLTALPPTINLSNNRLNGTIPQDIGQLKMLLALGLSWNNLSGSIPASIGNLTNLEILDLSGNELSGVIPSSLTQLHFLSNFNVAFNNLSGPVPTGGQFNTFSNSSYDGNSHLCGQVVMRTCRNPTNDNELLLTSESFHKILDGNTTTALVLGFHFGAVAAVFQQFYRDFMRAWRAVRDWRYRRVAVSI